MCTFDFKALFIDMPVLLLIYSTHFSIIGSVLLKGQNSTTAFSETAKAVLKSDTELPDLAY